jgi:meso-butanediol dehydrogenase/(S,S)-butanediol dehydrogenase/diacetyl reductase
MRRLEMGKLEGRVALNTGGGAGIGEAIAKLYIKEGAKVVVTGRRESVLAAFVDSQAADTAAYVQGDITKVEDSQKMVEETIARFGSLDILVNNAGIDPAGFAHEIPLETWTAVIDTNIHGTYYMIRHALPQMIKQEKGSIINISSLAGLRCIPAMTAYTTSKAAMVGLSNSIALDYGKYGIRSNVISPGATRTEMLVNAMGGVQGDADESLRVLTRFLPIARPAEPIEIAYAAVFLASDESLYITGQTLPVDGGATDVDPNGVSTLDYGKSSWGQ